MTARGLARAIPANSARRHAAANRGQRGAAELEIADQSSAELRIVGQVGVVGGQAHSGGESQSLLGGDRQPAVVVEHPLIATESIGVLGGAAQHLSVHQRLTWRRCCWLTPPGKNGLSSSSASTRS